MYKTDTICAIASAMTNAGIGIIRVSGSDAIEKVDRIYKGKQKLTEVESHTVQYGHIVYDDKVIDEVMVLVLKAPRTYTTEDTVEIDCHGGTLVMQEILKAVIAQGVRPAEPGEFTKRAFLNGRIDLSQAESVMDVISSNSNLALHNSINQLQGIFSDQIKDMRSKIIYEIAYIESALDDPEHIDITGYGEELLPKIQEIIDQISHLLATADNGSMLKEGIKTTIIGKPNAGKSSLLNLLARKDRAIVTDIAGTTRDTLEEQISLNGIALRIIDTAGIRHTEDVVEKIGVKKAYDTMENADLILYVVDASRPLDENDIAIMEKIKDLMNMETVHVALEFGKKHGLKALLLKSRHKLQGLDNDYDYGEWYELTRPKEEELAAQREARFSYEPLLSIVIPAYKTPEKYLREMLDSILAQTYRNWEVCVANGSPKGEGAIVSRVMAEYTKKDSRFHVSELGDNLGISGNTNAALGMAKGDFIILADHDDTIPEHALYEVAKTINGHPDCDVIYSDEDKLDMDGGALFDPHFKPDFNPDLLTSVNYICHLFVVKKELLDQVGGFRQEFDGAQDHDFLLRMLLGNVLFDQNGNGVSRNNGISAVYFLPLSLFVEFYFGAVLEQHLVLFAGPLVFHFGVRHRVIRETGFQKLLRLYRQVVHLDRRAVVGGNGELHREQAGQQNKRFFHSS